MTRIITADYVNELLHEIVTLKKRINDLELVDRHVRRLLVTAVVDDNFPTVKNDLVRALKNASLVDKP